MKMFDLRFDQIIGTGGIGTGILFEMEGDRPLSRNETRLARLSPTRDYCKQHIILHYIARILAPNAVVTPIGLVGTDDAGRGLLRQMEDAGMDVRLVGQTDRRPTMYCVCMQYPDKAVCNVTTSESACSLVDRAYVAQALEKLKLPLSERTLVVAAPEVPVEARLELLQRAHASGAYCVASCLVDEFDAYISGDGLRHTDLLIINEDEAAALCKDDGSALPERARACHTIMRGFNPNARLVMTCGADGSYVCDNDRMLHLPVQPTTVISTGGAGDAYTAGTICGLALGLPFAAERGSAPELGARLAARAIAEVDTIADGIDRGTVMDYLTEIG